MECRSDKTGRLQTGRHAGFGGVEGARRSGHTRSAVLLAAALACIAGPVGAARALAAESCPNAAARQGPSAGLPECRAYEQVTPVDKGAAVDLFPSETHGGSSEPEPFPVDRGQAGEQGDEFLLNAATSIGPTAPPRGAYLFVRGGAGWTTAIVGPALDAVHQVVAEVFDPANLSAVGFFEQSGAAADAYGESPSTYQQHYLVGAAEGPYSPMSMLSGPAAGESERIHVVGGSEDLSRVVLETQNRELAPGGGARDAGSDALYEWDGGGECGVETTNCKAIDVNDNGTPVSECGATVGKGGQGDHLSAEQGGTHGAVSSDGSKIFFTAPDPGMAENGPGCWNPATQEDPPELYMREDGERTVEISKPEEGVQITAENPLLPAVFVGASSNGSKVFFMTMTELTKNAVGHTPELYEYETESGTLTLISGNVGGTAEGNVDFVGAVSSDGSAVYFAAYGDLASGASPLAPEGQNEYAPVNLYRYDTRTETTTFITTVDALDYPLLPKEAGTWTNYVFGAHNEGHAEMTALDAGSEWYATGNGEYLLFGSYRQITGFDSTEAPGVRCANLLFPSAPSPTTCLELYRYDAAANRIVCVSCAGGAPAGDAVFARTYFDVPAAAPPRPISENGEDVFFDSASALVPQATPGKVHVYEWHAGTISMISSPSDPGEAFFLGSSANGADVYFSTHSQLAPQDTDVSDDIYDARVDGGFPEANPPSCTETGCQGVPAAPPIFATPASVTFGGAGNPRPPAKPGPRPHPRRCGRGAVKRHGRCVKAKKRATGSAKGRK